MEPGHPGLEREADVHPHPCLSAKRDTESSKKSDRYHEFLTPPSVLVSIPRPQSDRLLDLASQQIGEAFRQTCRARSSLVQSDEIPAKDYKSKQKFVLNCKLRFLLTEIY